MFPKGFTTSPNHVLCANFVKIGWPEISKVVHCLPDKKKTKLPRGLLLSLLCADRVQNLSEPAPNNMLRVPQISSKSVHFRQSYRRTREHRWNMPQSISNTRWSFFAFGEASSPSKKCISVGLIASCHTVSWHPRPKFTQFGKQVSIGQTPNPADFHHAVTKSARYLLPKISAPGKKWTKVH